MPTKFAILGVQRTGTTWIRTTLNNHPSILALGEVFLYSQGRFPFRRKAGTDVEQSYRKFIEQTPGRRLRHFLDRDGMIRAYLQQIYSQPGFGAIGFKLMRTQCSQFPMVVRLLLQERISVIHVIRLNVLKTHISRETARQRRLFHSKDKVPPVTIHLDIKTLRSSLDSITHDNQEWERIFQGSNYLQLAYESFVCNRDDELRRLYEFLCVPADHAVSSDLVKINPESIAEVVTNYDEVHCALQATPYAWCLSHRHADAKTSTTGR